MNHEYGVYSREFKRFFKYDFVSLPLKIAIEFHGDHYHGTPKLYRPFDKLKGRGQGAKTAAEAWHKDSIKEKAMLDERGFDLITVWEYDYRNDGEEVLKNVYEYIKRIRHI